MHGLALKILPIAMLFASVVQAQSAREIVKRADDLMNGTTSFGTMTLTVIRPEWTREVTMKSWSKGRDFSLILITAPARDKGTAFLKREREIWNWQPGIDRTIKMPPSMMSQSWMGSDFTNDDLVRQSSVVDDYEHIIDGEEVIENRACWKIQMVPKPDAPVVWGKVLVWIDKLDFIQLKVAFYDEDEALVNTMYGKNIGELGGKKIARTLEVVPSDKAGHVTRVVYSELVFDKPIEDSFFSIQNLKKIR